MMNELEKCLLCNYAYESIYFDLPTTHMCYIILYSILPCTAELL
jgi:hypothetical protein